MACILDLGCHSVRTGFVGAAEPQLIYPNATGYVTQESVELLADAGLRDFQGKLETHYERRVNALRPTSGPIHAGFPKKKEYTEQELLKRLFKEFPLNPLMKRDDIIVERIVNYTLTDGKPEYFAKESNLAMLGDALWGLEGYVVPELVFVEPTPRCRKLREKYLEVSFESFMTPALFSASSQLFRAAGAGLSSGIVMDVGYSHTTACSVLEGNIVQQSVNTSPIGTAEASRIVFDYISKNNTELPTKLLCSLHNDNGNPIFNSYKQLNKNTVGNSGPFRSVIAPFLSESYKDWQKDILVDMIGIHLGMDGASNFNLPDGTAIESDIVTDNLNQFLLGGIITKLGTNEVGLLSALEDVTHQLHKILKGRGVRKNKKGAAKGGTTTSISQMPVSLLMSGGGSIFKGFDDEFLKQVISHKRFDWLGWNSEEGINHTRESLGSAENLWKNIERNPNCTKTLLEAVGVGDAKPLPDYKIMSGDSDVSRIYDAFRGASIVGTLESFDELKVSIGTYAEMGLEQAVARLLPP